MLDQIRHIWDGANHTSSSLSWKMFLWGVYWRCEIIFFYNEDFVPYHWAPPLKTKAVWMPHYRPEIVLDFPVSYGTQSRLCLNRENGQKLGLCVSQNFWPGYKEKRKKKLLGRLELKRCVEIPWQRESWVMNKKPSVTGKTQERGEERANEKCSNRQTLGE